MKSSFVRAACVAAVLGAVTAGCAGGDQQSETGNTGNTGNTENSAAGSSDQPVAEQSVETIDDLVAVLEAAGLCESTSTPADTGALQAGNPLIPEVTKTVYCDEQTTHAMQISGFATVADRDRSIGDGFGDAYHYVGTGENRWIIEVDYDEGKAPLEETLGDEASLV